MKKWFLLLLIPLATFLFYAAQELHHAQPALSQIPEKMVTLTFDDGPDPSFTPSVLKLLKERNLKATFFVVGENAVANPELLREIVQNGHTVANHTYTHRKLEEMGKDEVYSELSKTDIALYSILGPSRSVSHYFRPPRGKMSSAIAETVEEMKKQTVLWNVCVENHNTKTPEQVRQRVMKLIRKRNGGILLAHDGELDRSLTVQSLPLILDDLQREGYRIVPLDVYLEAQRNLAKN